MWLMRNSITLRFFLVHELQGADRAPASPKLTELHEGGKLVHTIARRLPSHEARRSAINTGFW